MSPRLALLLPLALLAACSSLPGPRAPSPAPPGPGAVPAPAPTPRPSTKYYLDDGPGASAPADLDSIPDAVPRLEPLHRFANRPYVVFGREYVPATSVRAYRERGVASWYGRKFHGQRTSSGEVYDMYAMTAAHPTLPLPSFARVTSIATGRSVVVRVNDRGPFLYDRVIDLSYAAAHRLGIAQKGSGEVEVEAIIPAGVVTASAPPLPPVAIASATPAAPAVTAPAPPVEALPPIPVAPLASGFVVQLGAFASNANAQNFVARLVNQLAPVGVEAKIRQADGLFRVYVGPYPTRDEARRMSERLRESIGLASTVAVH